MLDPLFPVKDVRAATAGHTLLRNADRHGHVGPVTSLCGFIEKPTIAVELAFYPVGDFPEPLTEESWVFYRDALGLAPFAGPSSL